jgi:hypothetical protein
MRNILLFTIFCVFSAYPIDDELNAFISTPLPKRPLTIIVSPDYWFLSAELKAFYQELIQSYLIESGHKLIERKRLQDIFSEKSLSQSGATSQDTNLFNDGKNQLLKDAGALLGADYLLIFSTLIGYTEKEKVETHSIGFRLVDCSSGLIAISGHLRQVLPLHSARLIAYSITVAQNTSGWIIGEHKTSLQSNALLSKKLGYDYYVYEKPDH